MTNMSNTKILRINSIIDNPVPIESLFNLEKYNLLAVGRSDNTIEIWNTNTWVQLMKINGTQSINIKKVFLIKKQKKDEAKNLFNNLRLFSIGTNGYLIEWSLFTGEPKVNFVKYF
jgi:WD40 repeat protein